MHGYKNFFFDVKLAFKDLLKRRLLSVRQNDYLQKWKHSKVILESKYQYLSLSIEFMSVQFFLIEKETYKFIFVDELLSLNHIVFDEQSKKYAGFAYKELLGMKDMSDKEQIRVLQEHYCIGELYSYAKLVETVLYKYIFESEESWVALAEQNGKQVIEGRINGLNF